MSAKYTFIMKSDDKKRPLPYKMLLAQKEMETVNHILLKFLAYVLFYRERLIVETRLDDEFIPYVPDLAQLDYTLRPVLWVECGECSVAKLHKLAAKAPEAEIFVIKKSLQEAEHLIEAMAKADLRRNRYKILALDHEMFSEMLQHTSHRNELHWFKGTFEPPALQFDYNGLWFDCEFELKTF